MIRQDCSGFLFVHIAATPCRGLFYLRLDGPRSHCSLPARLPHGKLNDPDRLSTSAVRVCMPCGCAYSLRKELAILLCGPVSGEKPYRRWMLSRPGLTPSPAPIRGRKEPICCGFWSSARTPIRTLHPYSSAPSLKKDWSRIRIRLESPLGARNTPLHVARPRSRPLVRNKPASPFVLT
jgi:hypothetical protein